MQLTAIHRLEAAEVAEPQITASDDVLLTMTCAGVCGSDVHYYETGRIGSQVVDFPMVLGHEGAARVEAVGPAVRGLAPGDRVAIEPAMPCHECDQCRAGRENTCRRLRFLGCPGQAAGLLSQRLVMPAECCLPVPAQMSDVEAAIVEPLAIGVYAVEQSVPMAGATVGVLGFGPIGMSVLLPALAGGAARVHVTDRLDYRLAVARACGAASAGNPESADVVADIAAREPELCDVVFECCGRQEALDQAIELLKPGGKLMIIGIPPELERWTLPTDIIRRKELTVQNVRRQRHCTAKAIELIASGAVDVSPMATHRFPFAATDQAFELVAGYRDGVMKAFIEFSESPRR
ncbi:MAG: alcohol dehydrogenase catalytic domain-containing protein [Planctomycetota bacterium]